MGGIRRSAPDERHSAAAEHEPASAVAPATPSAQSGDAFATIHGDHAGSHDADAQYNANLVNRSMILGNQAQDAQAAIPTWRLLWPSAVKMDDPNGCHRRIGRHCPAQALA